jgi:hypothetical protein
MRHREHAPGFRVDRRKGISSEGTQQSTNELDPVLIKSTPGPVHLAETHGAVTHPKPLSHLVTILKVIAQIFSRVFLLQNNNADYGVLRAVRLDSGELFQVWNRDYIVPAICFGMFVFGRSIEIKTIADPGSLILGNQLEVNRGEGPNSGMNEVTQSTLPGQSLLEVCFPGHHP